MGMSVFLPTQPGEKVTVFDQVYANLQAKFVALFLVIFTVLFSSADIGSGYIKNIGGQVRSRRNLIFSKASVLFVYTTVTMLLYFIIQIVDGGIKSIEKHIHQQQQEKEKNGSVPDGPDKKYVCGMDCDGGSYILLHIHVETGY